MTFHEVFILYKLSPSSPKEQMTTAKYFSGHSTTSFVAK